MCVTGRELGCSCGPELCVGLLSQLCFPCDSKELGFPWAAAALGPDLSSSHFPHFKHTALPSEGSTHSCCPGVDEEGRPCVVAQLSR